MASNASSPSSGSLLGTNALQGTIDKFTAAVNTLDGVVKSMASSPTSFARNSGGNGSSAQQQPAYGGFPGVQNPFMGGSGYVKPIMSYNAQTGQTAPTGGYYFNYAGQAQPGQSFPNGGGPPVGGGSRGGAFGLPTTMGAAGGGFYGAVKAFGSGQLPVQAAMSNYVQLGTLAAPNGMGNGAASQNLRNVAFGNGYTTLNAIANNAGDAMQGAALINWASGGFAGMNSMGSAMTGAANMFGYSNQGLGYYGSAQLAQQLYSPQMSMRLMQMGYPVTPRALGGGRATPAPNVIGGMMGTWYGGRRSVSQQVLNAGLAPGGNVYNNLVYGMGLSGSSLTNMEGTIQGYNKLANAGYTNGQITSLFQGARNENQGDINKLNAAGITQSDLQVIKNRTAVQTGTSSNEVSGFNAGLRQSVGLLTQFNKVLAGLTGGTPLGSLFGFGGGIGAGGGLANFSGPLSMMGNGLGLLSRAPGLISGAAGTIGKIFGGAASPGAATSQSAPARSPNAGGAVSSAAVAAVGWAKQEIGVPYVWGGEQPGVGFDCSGLVQWAYGKAGVKLPRTSEAMWSALQNKSVPLNSVQEGDLLFSAGQGDGGTFSSPGHVAMMVSGNQLIQAPYTGSDVQVVPYNPSAWQHAARPTGSGTMGTGPGGTGSSTNGSAGGGGSMAPASTSEADNISSALGGMMAGGMGGANGGTTSATNGTSGSSSGPSGNTPSNSVARLAQQMAQQRGWGNQWGNINYVETREAGWNLRAVNPGSGAAGIAQFIDGWSEYYKYGGNPNTASGQITAFYNYMDERYHGPAGAAAHERQYNWYGTGTRNTRRGPMIVGDRGPEVLWSNGGDSITPANQLPALLSSNKLSGGGGCVINLQFGTGSIQISGVGGSDVSHSGREIAHSIGRFLEQENIIKKIAAGVSG